MIFEVVKSTRSFAELSTTVVEIGDAYSAIQPRNNRIGFEAADVSYYNPKVCQNRKDLNVSRPYYCCGYASP